MDTGLLELLAARCGCMYLSDLNGSDPRRRLPPQLAHEVMFIPAQSYPPAQWREAYRYMIGQEPAGDTGEACRQELLDALERMTRRRAAR